MDDKDKISLEDWKNQEIEIIYKFLEDWKNLHEIDPEDWPMVLPAGEWDEQFRLFHDECDD